MKFWRIVFCLFLMFFLNVARSQPCLTIGSTDGINAPFDVCGGNGSYNPAANLYSADASLYLSTEMCGFGTINAISFYCTNTWGSTSFPVVLYMKTQAGSTLAAGTYANMLSGATQVYSGSPTWPGAACVPCYMTITLQTPFTYTTGNLIIISETNRGGIPTCGTAPVFGYNMKANMHEWWWNNSPANRSSMSGSIDEYRNGLKFSDMSVLPIELENFSAQIFKEKVKLDWSTATELNNRQFTLEKSGDGTNFSQLTTVAGAGTSTTEKNYTVFDQSPAYGPNYYRLKQTDENGQFTYSQIQVVNFSERKNWISNLTPNPMAGEVNFDVNSPINGNLDIQVIDITGRVVFADARIVTAGNQNIQVSLDVLAGGVYSLRTSIAAAGYVSQTKIIKN